MSIYGHLLNESSLMPVYTESYIESTINELLNESFTFDSILEECDIALNEKVDLKEIKDKAIKVIKTIIEKIKQFISKIKDKIVGIIKKIKDKHKEKNLKNYLQKKFDPSKKGAKEFLKCEYEILDYSIAGKLSKCIENLKNTESDFLNSEYSTGAEYVEKKICGESWSKKHKISVKEFIDKYGDSEYIDKKYFYADDYKLETIISDLENKIKNLNENIKNIQSMSLEDKQSTVSSILNDENQVDANSITKILGLYNALLHTYMTIYTDYDNTYFNIWMILESGTYNAYV